MKAIAFLLLSLLPAPVTFAAAKPPAQASVPARAPSPFHAEFLANLAEVEDKIVRLAEATPADKYAWRPAGDVRSVSEVYMHIAGANYFLCTFVGVSSPSSGEDIEKSVTRKAEVVAELKRSFAHLRAAAASVRDLEKPVKLFGSHTSQRGVLLTVLNHLHEHLGQSIAYARMNGVTPPWSR